AWRGAAWLAENPLAYLARHNDAYDVIQLDAGSCASPEPALGDLAQTPIAAALSRPGPGGFDLFWGRLSERGCLSVVFPSAAVVEERAAAVAFCARLAALAREKAESAEDRLMILGWGGVPQASPGGVQLLEQAPWSVTSKEQKALDKAAKSRFHVTPLFACGETPSNLATYHLLLSRDAFSAEAVQLARAFCSETSGTLLVAPGQTPLAPFQAASRTGGAGDERSIREALAELTPPDARSDWGGIGLALWAAGLAFAVAGSADWRKSKRAECLPWAASIGALAAGTASGAGMGWMLRALQSAVARPEDLSFVGFGALLAGAALALGMAARGAFASDSKTARKSTKSGQTLLLLAIFFLAYFICGFVFRARQPLFSSTVGAILSLLGVWVWLRPALGPRHLKDHADPPDHPGIRRFSLAISILAAVCASAAGMAWAPGAVLDRPWWQQAVIVFALSAVAGWGWVDAAVVFPGAFGERARRRFDSLTRAALFGAIGAFAGAAFAPWPFPAWQRAATVAALGALAWLAAALAAKTPNTTLARPRPQPK
ncbi:MAG: hypothetical protein NTW86_20125, partial [Candidatus Sumerlaeota bacterium]|nr:hypothetical protein [Candidatus Sumerlaeota bacterium]